MTYNPVASSGLKLALENSLVSHNKFSWLGHVIFSKGIAPDDNMIRTIRDWDPPASNRELRSLFGILNYFSKFICLFGTSKNDTFPKV